jgi:hypothetical protein
MSMERKLLPTRQLTKHLRELAMEVETIHPDTGALINRAEALADLLWKKALGFTEVDSRTGETTKYKPEAWAIQMIWERLEGKAPPAIVDEQGGMTAAEKVSELARLRISAEADASDSIPESEEDVDLPDNPDRGP